MPNNPWDRQPKESEEAYAAFLAYRDMGVNRTIDGVVQKYAKGGGFRSLCTRWSGKWSWVERSRAWDNRLQGARDKVTLAEQEKWERRRQRSLANNWKTARKLRVLLWKMLNFPIEEEVTEKDGEQKIIAPAKWTFATAATLAKNIAELEAATINEAMPRGDDGFDPDTASPEECQAFLARQAGRGTPRT